MVKTIKYVRNYIIIYLPTKYIFNDNNIARLNYNHDKSRKEDHQQKRIYVTDLRYDKYKF